jgi:hypothetical protein
VEKAAQMKLNLKKLVLRTAVLDGVPNYECPEITAKNLLLIIEEVSQVSATLFAAVDLQCQNLFGPGAFGGMHIILCGDFFQLPPPKEMSLFSALVRTTVGGTTASKLTSAEQRAAVLFAQFTRYPLDEQMRASGDSSEDLLHLQMIQDMRTTTSPTPFTTSHLINIRPLTQQDVVVEPSWMFASILVTSNLEVTVLEWEQLRAFARATGEPMFYWFTPLKIGSGHGHDAFERPPLTLTRNLAENGFPMLRVGFVRNAPVMLARGNFNIARGFDETTGLEFPGLHP